MQKNFILFIGCFITLCLQAQINSNAGPFISFSNEGQTLGLNNSTGIKANASIKDSNNLLQMLTCMFINPSTNDTLILVAKDAAGFKPGEQHIFSADSKLLFYYKVNGKGIFIKMMDNTKNEIKPGNYFNISKLENKPGGSLEGSFAFTDIAFENNNNQVTARIKAIKDGKFKTVVSDENLFGNKLNNNENALRQNNSGVAKNNTQLSEGAQALFMNIKCNLSKEEENQVFEAWGYNVKDTAFYMEDMEDHPFTPDVIIEDLNNDGTEEVFITSDDQILFGILGQTTLFMKTNGKYEANTGVSGHYGGVEKSSYMGYHDFSFMPSGLADEPGTPIWRWNGKVYEYYKSIPESDEEYKQDTLRISPAKTTYESVKPYPAKNSFLNVLKIFIADSSATSNISNWNTATGTASPIKWQHNYAEKFGDDYSRSGNTNIFFENTVNAQTAGIAISGSSKNYYSNFSFGLNKNRFGMSLDSLLGKNDCKITLLKKCALGMYSESQFYELTIPGKKTVWASTNMYYGRNDISIEFFLFKQDAIDAMNIMVCEGENNYVHFLK